MNDKYMSPFSTRYSSREMLNVFSSDEKFKTWRKLWLALAEAQKELGLDITEEQINELKKNVENINYKDAVKKERETRHDVPSHIYAYGLLCPKAKGIIHLGATSCYVGDNTDLIIYRKALNIIKKKLVFAIKQLRDFAIEYKDLPALGFTHFQPAQPTTVGKRASLWLHDLIIDFEDLEYVLSNYKMRGIKGTTGTQASFLKLFDGNHEKVKALDEYITRKMGFDNVYPVTGQTYTRKQDSRIMNVLSGIAQSAYKFSNDMRLLQNMKEIEEPFENKQIGSSAMAYKRNPMRSERISSLSRYVIINSLNPAVTSSTQWLERTLDDSANRRISMSEAFLAVDAVLMLYINIVKGIVVYPKVINKHLMEELPFMATENILMEAVKNGGDRQELHEKIRVHSLEAAKNIKIKGLENDLLERILNDKSFNLKKKEIDKALMPENYIGRCVEQVEEFIRNYADPVINNERIEDMDCEIKV